MIVKSHVKEYTVNIESDFLFLDKYKTDPNTFWVIDENIYKLYSDLFMSIDENLLLIIKALEQNKNIESALEICERMTSLAAKRNTTIISIGGGIIQDISGFAANVLYRGVNWVYVPTTLLAACDSCIGGKTSLNYRNYKNLIGTFFAPGKVIINPEWFQTLTEKDFKSGLGEVLKFNLMAGEKGIENIERDIELLLNRNEKVINDYIVSSLQYKKTFIEQDEYDRGERVKLNFAHTFGHAIEVISEYEIPHGTAVAIGMIMANKISLERKNISLSECERMENLLFKVIDIIVENIDKTLEEYLQIIKKDKKQTGNSLTAVLISKYGVDSELTVVHDITSEEINTAIHYFINKYRLVKR